MNQNMTSTEEKDPWWRAFSGACREMWVHVDDEQWTTEWGFFPVSDSDFIGNAVLKMKVFPFFNCFYPWDWWNLDSFLDAPDVKVGTACKGGSIISLLPFNVVRWWQAQCWSNKPDDLKIANFWGLIPVEIFLLTFFTNWKRSLHNLFKVLFFIILA